MSSDAWLSPEPSGRTDVEGSVDIDAGGADVESADVPDQLAEYVEMQEQIEPPD